MSGISDLGINLGYIYTVDVDGTTIVRATPNTEEGARNIMIEGVKSRSAGQNQRPSGTITVATITGVGSITTITINGIDQIEHVAIPYTGATTTTALATLIKDAINSYKDNTANQDYTATSSGAVVYLYGEEAIGSSHNTLVPIVTTTGNSTYTISEISGGSDASSLYNETYGYRFFLNADYNASGCSGLTTATPDSLTNAIEITKYVVPQMLNAATDIQTITISSDSISPTRGSIETLIYIETEASAASDTLTNIVPSGFANGDRIIIRGVSSARITTIKESKNIELQGNVSFDTDTLGAAIVLQLKDSTWYELSRTTQSIGAMSDYRTAGYGFFGLDTYATNTLVSGAAVTYKGGVDSKFQDLTGTVVLGANTSYSLGAGVNGDEFILTYNAAVTIGAFSLAIFGISLTTEQALNGGLIFHAKYVSGAWKSVVYPNIDSSVAVPYTIPTELYKALSITVPKVEATLSTDLILSQISWDTNRLGDHKIVIPYPCTVVQIDIYVDELIEATDNADVNFKDNAAASMGTVTLLKASTIGSGFSLTPVANNTFVAGDILTMTTTKTTVGGNAKVSIKVTKS